MLYANHKNKLLGTSILFLLLLGIAFIVYPADSMIMLVRLTGAFLIVLGILIFVPTLRERKTLGIRFGMLVAMTIVIAVFGVILLTMPGAFVEVFWITMGIILILDGIKNFLYMSAVPNKLITIILAVVSIICGVLIITHPFGTGLAFSILIGAFYAYSGASGIFLHFAGKFMKKTSPLDAGADIGEEGTVVDAEIVDGAEKDPDGDVKMIETADIVDEAEAIDETEAVEAKVADVEAEVVGAVDDAKAGEPEKPEA